MSAKRKHQITDEILDAVARQFPRHGSLKATCRAIGLSELHYKSISYHFWKMGDSSPVLRKTIPQKYAERTGESMKNDIMMLARRHSKAEVASMLGYASVAGLDKHMRKLGISTLFAGRKTHVVGDVTEEQAARYMELRRSGMSTHEAAHEVGRCVGVMRQAAYKMFPEESKAMRSRWHNHAGAKQA